MKMIAPLFIDLIRAGVVIIITAVTTAAAALMASLCSTLQKKILPWIGVEGSLRSAPASHPLFPPCAGKAVFQQHSQGLPVSFGKNWGAPMPKAAQGSAGAEFGL